MWLNFLKINQVRQRKAYQIERESSVIDGSRLQHSDAVIDPQLPWQRLRIIGLQRKAWHLDPVVEHAQDWRLWIWEGRPLSEVEWDPGEWR